MRIVALSNDKDANGTAIRIGIPLCALAENWPIELRMRSFHQCTRADLRWGDVFIVQRAIDARMHAVMRRLKEMGKPVIYEIDDLLTALPDFLQDHQTLHGRRELVTAMISMADAVSTTTARLAAQLSSLNPNLHVVPNYGNATRKSIARHAADLRPQASLLLAASDTVQTDFLQPALQAVYARYGVAVELVCIGAIARAIDVTGMTIHRHPIVPQARFADLIAALPNPVGLIPLDESLFSSCKTAVKFFDYTAAGIPSICSNVSPYRDVVHDRHTGLLVDNTTAGWSHAIGTLIDSPALRERLRDHALADIRQHHDLSHTIAAWQALLASVAKPMQATGRAAPHIALRYAYHDLIDRARVFLSDFNRARLERRKAGKMRGGPRDTDDHLPTSRQ